MYRVTLWQKFVRFFRNSNSRWLLLVRVNKKSMFYGKSAERFLRWLVEKIKQSSLWHNTPDVVKRLIVALLNWIAYVAKFIVWPIILPIIQSILFITRPATNWTISNIIKPAANWILANWITFFVNPVTTFCLYVWKLLVCLKDKTTRFSELAFDKLLEACGIILDSTFWAIVELITTNYRLIKMVIKGTFSLFYITIKAILQFIKDTVNTTFDFVNKIGKQIFDFVNKIGKQNVDFVNKISKQNVDCAKEMRGEAAAILEFRMKRINNTLIAARKAAEYIRDNVFYRTPMTKRVTRFIVDSVFYKNPATKSITRRIIDNVFYKNPTVRRATEFIVDNVFYKISRKIRDFLPTDIDSVTTIPIIAGALIMLVWPELCNNLKTQAPFSIILGWQNHTLGNLNSGAKGLLYTFDTRGTNLSKALDIAAKVICPCGEVVQGAIEKSAEVCGCGEPAHYGIVDKEVVRILPEGICECSEPRLMIWGQAYYDPVKHYQRRSSEQAVQGLLAFFWLMHPNVAFKLWVLNIFGNHYFVCGCEETVPPLYDLTW